MGREKLYRQRQKYQVNSVRKKSLPNQIQTELIENLGLSKAEAELLAERIEKYLLEETSFHGSNQVFIQGANSSTAFGRGKGATAKKEIKITPIHEEDLDLELEFGLKTMQLGRALRIIEESLAQDSLISLRDLSYFLNITPPSLRQRLRETRLEGIRVPVRGLAKKERAKSCFYRSTIILEKYFLGEDLTKFRKKAAISRGKLRQILARFNLVAREALSSSFESQNPEETEWIKLLERLPEEDLLSFCSNYKVPIDAGEPSGSRFRKELKEDFGYSPIRVRAILEFLEELKDKLKNRRSPEQLIYWAVAASEPPGRPLDECKLVQVPLTFFSEEDIISQHGRKDLYQLGDIKFRKLLRYSTEAKVNGGYLTQSDLSFLLGIHPDAIRRMIKNNNVHIPLRGSECDIGRGLTHRCKIIELYLQMYTETDIADRTGHSYEAIENYLHDFATILLLRDRGLPPVMIRKITGRSMKLVKTYLDIIDEYSAPEYYFRLNQLRRLFSVQKTQEKRGP